MKKCSLLLLIIFISLNFYSQISFEKGYYINNSNQKIECFIKNIDWRNNPTEFIYKLTENSDNKTATIETVKEFEIYNEYKYVRHTVNMDRSSNDIKVMSTVRKAIFKEETLFLKTLIEGKAGLFLYKDGNLIRFFYSKDSSEVKQLVFKEYLHLYDKIAVNNQYKQQLWTDLKCPSFNMNKVENVKYKKNDLIRFFVEYNTCTSHEFKNFEEKQKRDLFNLSFRPGIENSSLSVHNSISNTDTYFDNETKFRYGIEAEFILPFNKNKWAFLIEPTYQHFASEKELSTQTVKVNYESIELPVGIRHYFFLSNNSKIFINGSLINAFIRNSGIAFDNGPSLEIIRSSNFAFGIGYKHNDKYSIELRYHTSKELLSDYVIWTSDYKTLSIILGYSLF